MTFEEYANEALELATPKVMELGIMYGALGLAGEAGEVAEKVKKTFRDHDGDFNQERSRLVALEIGDTLWYDAFLAHTLGIPLDEIARMNLAKLRSRHERNQLHGDGDTR